MSTSTTDRVVSASSTIDAPAEAIFAIIAAPRQHPRIDGSGTVKDSIKGPERLGLGDKFGMSMKQGVPYKITSTVTEYDENRRLAWRHPLGHTWRYVLEPTAEGGTRVTESFDYSEVNGIQAKFLEVMGYPKKNRRGIEQTLVRLAEAARADAAGNPAP
ncbi:MAG: SRPBCC family protein [Nocardioides sp.]